MVGISDSIELQMSSAQIRSAFKDGNDATIAKAFVGSIFVEIETAFLLIVEEVEVLLGKFLLDCLFVIASSKGGRAIDTKAVSVNFQSVSRRIEIGDFVC